MRTDLSPSTWIEDSYIYTRSVEVAAAWMGDCLLARTNGRWQYEWHISAIGVWCLSLTAAREVYRYREGEPWCEPEDAFVDGGVFGTPIDTGAMSDDSPRLHLRAVIACGGSADSLRALAGALTFEPVGQGE